MAGLAARLSGDAMTRAMNRKDRFLFGSIVAACADCIAAGALLEDTGRVGCANECRHHRPAQKQDADDQRMQEACIRGNSGHVRSLKQAVI